jgi:hypothetical protein
MAPNQEQATTNSIAINPFSPPRWKIAYSVKTSLSFGEAFQNYTHESSRFSG